MLQALAQPCGRPGTVVSWRGADQMMKMWDCCIEPKISQPQYTHTYVHTTFSSPTPYPLLAQMMSPATAEIIPRGKEVPLLAPLGFLHSAALGAGRVPKQACKA